jgi:hypothetical protein
VIVFLLKWAAQILIVVAGITGLFSDSQKTDPSTGKKSLTHVGWITIIALIIGFLLFIATDFAERKENARKDSQQKQQIAELEKVVKKLNKLSLDRELKGVEISFKPSAEQSSRIAAAYEKIKSPVPEIPYSAATMKAERVNGGWAIDFDPVSRKEGTIRFAPIPPDEPAGKAFAEVIRESSIGLWIKWGDSAETELEPLRNAYPSAISVSQELITLTLKQPVLELSLNDLDVNSTIILRGRNDTSSLRFRSLDQGAAFDQTIELNWKRDDSDVSTNSKSNYIKRTKPYISGPHHIDVTFNTASQ